LFSLLEKGRVIGIEVDLKPQNRDAIRTGPLASSISLVDGSSVDANTLAAVRAQIRTGEKVMVVLDSNHTRDHVLAELRAYAPLVTTGSYIVVCDGHHAGSRWSRAPLPTGAGTIQTRPFLISFPRAKTSRWSSRASPFNESLVTKRVTYCPNAYLKLR